MIFLWLFICRVKCFQITEVYFLTFLCYMVIKRELSFLLHTYKELKRLHCKRVFVVTDMFHTYRSNLITAAVWGGRIPFYMVPYGISVNKKDESYAIGQFFVALLWRLTGVLVYEKRLKEKRKSIYTETEKHSLFELGF